MTKLGLPIVTCSRCCQKYQLSHCGPKAEGKPFLRDRWPVRGPVIIASPFGCAKSQFAFSRRIASKIPNRLQDQLQLRKAKRIQNDRMPLIVWAAMH